MTTSWESRTFDSVRIGWRAERAGTFDVKVWWLDSLIVAATIGPAAPRLPFSARTEDDDQRVAGLLEVVPGERALGALVLRSLSYPGGEVKNVVLWPPEPPPPPPPPPPSPGDDPPPEELEATVDSEGDHDLFPYVYIRPWPSPSAQELADRFVGYSHTCDPGSDTLYCRLVQEHTDRAAMERDAVDFIDGKPPYTGQFLGRIDQLEGPIAAFGSVDAELRRRAAVTLRELKSALEQRLGMTWDEIAAYVTSDPTYAQQLDRAWQNLFALVIVLGYDRELRDAVIRTVVMARLVERIAANDSDAAWPPPTVRDGIHATVILPETILPMPPASPPPPPPSAATSALARAGAVQTAPEPIRAYAIGDLQLVRQRLLRYELGEVSAIENVMRGESKTTTRRTLSRRAETSTEDSTAEQESGTALFGTRAELLDELGKTIAAELKLDETTTYGPPAEGTATSSITIAPNQDGKPQLDLQDQASQFARTVTARTTGRMARVVRRARVVSVLDEDETTVVARLEGSASGPVHGIYRWVNKVYQAHVVNYGRRLILEALIKDPARAYISSEQSLQGVSLTTPTSLAELGVLSFRDISRDPQAPGYYAALAARYDARDITPPPPAVETTGAAFQAGVDVHIQELRVPEGYRARRAHVTASWVTGAPSSEAFGIVGREPFRIDSSAPQTVTLSLSSEGAAIPVAFGARPLPAPPQGEAAKTADGCLATIELEAELDDRTYEQWQIRTYDVLAAAFQRQRDAYLVAAGTAPTRTATRNPLSSREVVRQQLQRDVMRELQRLVVQSTGEPGEVLIGAPRYAQFFEQAFEWREMAFSFMVQTGDTPASRAVGRYDGEDQLFTAFLQAGFARVLLPVRPDYDFAVPYLLASGMLWDGPDALAPANQSSVALINDLKTAAQRPPERAVRSKPWEIRVPTSMVMLQDGAELPGLLTRGAR